MTTEQLQQEAEAYANEQYPLLSSNQYWNKYPTSDQSYDDFYSEQSLSNITVRNAYLAAASKYAEENERLKKENEKMREAIRFALNIKTLWLYGEDVKPEHETEAEALANMQSALEYSLTNQKGE